MYIIRHTQSELYNTKHLLAVQSLCSVHEPGVQCTKFTGVQCIGVHSSIGMGDSETP